MKKMIIAVVALLTANFAKAQGVNDFNAFAGNKDSLMHAAYEAKDVPAYLKQLSEYMAAYNKLSASDREDYRGNLATDYYNLSCTYALVGDKKNALDYLEKSAYYNYDHLLQDHDIDTLRNEQRFIKFLDVAKRRRDLYKGTAFKTRYKPNLSDEEKEAGLSLMWLQARNNFVYFDHTNVDWNQTYLDYLAKIKNTKTTAEYYHVLEAFYALLKDGHTGVVVPQELRNDFYSRPPMLTELIEGRVFITKVTSDSLQKEGVVPGLEILKIDDVPVMEYVGKEIKPYESSSTPQDMEIRAFTYALLCGPDKKPVVLELKDRKGKIFTKTVARSGYHDVRFQKPVDYETIGDIGYLVVNNFESEVIEKLYDQLFDSISKTKGLIIDIRNNGGGSSSVGYHIIQTLVDKPFKSSACKRLKYISRPGESVEWEDLQPDENAPDGKRYYSKPVIVLIGPRTFSAAEDFTVAFDYAKRGKLVGRPTGGSTGQPVPFSLPGGGSARVCGKRDTYPDGKEFVGIGIMPDVVVTPTIKDLLNGIDAAKNKAVELLKDQ